ncbi:NfeD family protein [Mycoplasma sp. HU2014]|uniref:NfeD family protein n=1 Tax=Mycoplasma sp. HU2014 TaxID=1664275 RepID=UPI00067D50BF|nr:NfeD family protein [Mycoplasma sp. HU2014]KNG78980.1 NfeD family protein [Mycoplasma sp. HU2014]
MLCVWLIVLLVSLFIEYITFGIVSIWFSLGSAIALILAGVNVEYWIQIVVFSIITLLSLIVIMPITKKIIKKNKKPNVNTKIGNIVELISDIDDHNKGYALINDVKWQVICDKRLFKNTKVEIIEVKGNKLIVKESV